MKYISIPDRTKDSHTLSTKESRNLPNNVSVLEYRAMVPSSISKKPDIKSIKLAINHIPLISK